MTPDTAAETISWYAGTTTVQSEQRAEGNALVFGSRIDGVFHENMRLVFETPAEAEMAARTADDILRKR